MEKHAIAECDPNLDDMEKIISEYEDDGFEVCNVTTPATQIKTRHCFQRSKT